MSIQDKFELPIAYDPNANGGAGGLVGGAEFTVHREDDTSFSTPLLVSDPTTGISLSPLRSSSVGVLPDFRVEGEPPVVLLRSGDFVTKLASKFGIFSQAGWDRSLAEEAVAAGPVAVAAAQEATQRAAEVAAVPVTTDGIMTGVAREPASEFNRWFVGNVVPVFTPDGYGAVRSEVWSADAAAANDRAFAEMTAAALAEDGKIEIAPGVYPINRWVVDAMGLQHLVIQGDGVVLLIPTVHASGVTNGDAAVWIGSSTAAPDGAGFLRRLEIAGISVVSSLDFSSTTRTNRRGLVIKGVQDITAGYMWVGGFNYQGVTLDTVYDSYFDALTIYRSGRSQPTSANASNPTGNRYALEITSTMGDNSNALRFNSLRVESCPLMLRIDMPDGYTGPSVGPRQIDFHGVKLEQRETNQSELPPIWFGKATGIHFYGGGIVRNVLEILGGQQTPYTVGSSDRGSTVSNSGYQKSITFHGTSFATNTNTAALWAEGHRLTFEDCDFQLSTSFSPQRPAFNLGDDCVVRGGTVTFAATVPQNPSHTPRTDFVRFFGKRSIVEDVKLYVPSGPSGTMLTVADTAEYNEFKVRSTFGGHSTKLTLESGTQIGARVLVAPTDPTTGTVAAPTPDVFNRQFATLLTGTYSDFLGASTGQTLTLAAGVDQTPTLTHSTSLRLRGNASRTLASQETVTLRRVAGFWAET